LAGTSDGGPAIPLGSTLSVRKAGGFLPMHSAPLLL
jgi:hypothetical protein